MLEGKKKETLPSVALGSTTRVSQTLPPFFCFTLWGLVKCEGDDAK